MLAEPNLRKASTMHEQPPLPFRRRQAFSKSCAAASGGGSTVSSARCGRHAGVGVEVMRLLALCGSPCGSWNIMPPISG